MIYPVNYVLDGDDIVFGSDPGPKVEAGLHGPVCFEADRLNCRSREGWSVVVPGRVEGADSPRQSAWPRILALPLKAWTAQEAPFPDRRRPHHRKTRRPIGLTSRPGPTVCRRQR